MAYNSCHCILFLIAIILFDFVMTSDQGNVAVGNTDTEWGRAVDSSEHDPNEASCQATSTDATSKSMPSKEPPYDEEVDVAIIGGGLAGLLAAIGLSRANITCRVYERANELRSVSQGLVCVQPNGMTALESVHPSLPDLITKAGCQRHHILSTTVYGDKSKADEERLIDSLRDGLDKYGRATVDITWHRIQQVLASLVPKDIITTGYSLQSYSEDHSPDYVLLQFANGKTVRASTCLGCDGVFSTVRRQMMMHNSDDKPVTYGQMNWASIIRTNDLPENVHPKNAVHAIRFVPVDSFEEGDKRVEYDENRSEKDDVDSVPRWFVYLSDAGGGDTFFQFRVTDAEKGLALSGTGGRGGLGLPGVKATLLRLAQPCKLVADAIERMPEANIFERSIVARLPATTWRSPSGRIALLGDSAHGMHPLIGQGANSAYISVTVAVEELINCKGKWSAGLEAYERRRKRRADVVHKFANAMGIFQSAGDMPSGMSLSDRQLMSDWILENDESAAPPSKIQEFVSSYDLISEPSVSLIG